MQHGIEYLNRTPRTDAPRIEARRTFGGRYTIEISGRLPYDWAGRLARGLARSGVTILSVKARRGEMCVWEGKFEVEPIAGSSDLERIDFLDLMERVKPVTHDKRWGLKIANYNVGSPKDHGGALYVEIEGMDRPGFLSAVLGHFASIALFPYEMSIKTHGDIVHDVFHLKCIGGAEPSEETRQTMEYILDMIVNNRYNFIDQDPAG